MVSLKFPITIPYLAYRAVDEECPKDDNSQQHWTGSLDNFEMAVFVSEENNHRETSDDDTLEHEQDCPEDHVERYNTRRTVLALVTTLRTLKTLEGVIHVIQSQVDSLQNLNGYNFGSIKLRVDGFNLHHKRSF